MIPIFKPYMPIGVNEELNNILYSGKLSFGKYGKLFEKELIKYVKSENILTTSSYNNALQIVLSVLGLKEGDEVIASPVSCLASNQPFAVKNIKIVWADIDPIFGTLDIEDVKRKISSKTKAIYHNHYCGYLGFIDELNELARGYGIPVIDDCVEAFGSELNGLMAGNLGSDISVFSFQTVRIPNTIDGGGIVFKDRELLEKARLIRDYGIERLNFRDEINEINKDCDISLEGYGALPNEVNSFIGYKQMSVIPDLIEKQRLNAKVWDVIIADNNKKYKPLPSISGTRPNYWVYGILANNKVQTIKEFREKGFYATSVHINNNRYTVFNNQKELKGVNEFMNHFVAIPCGWWIDQNDINL